MIQSVMLLAATPTPADGLSTLRTFFQDGGFFIYPLIISSIIGMMVIVFKFMSLRRSTVVPESLAVQIEALEGDQGDGRWDSVQREFSLGTSTLSRLGAITLRHAGKPQSEINHAVEAAARGEMVRIHSGIQTLDVLITVAPLLGLLGTVSGLVAVFKGLSDTSDHLAIARGISEALHTTIFGISIAVVAVVAHGWFTRRIEMMTVRLESVLADLSRLCARPGNHS